MQVISGGPDSVEVIIALSHAGDTPPLLPNRNSHTWSREDLDRLHAGAGEKYLEVEAISALIQAISPLHGSIIGSAVVAGILGRGIKTDEYDCDPLKNVNILNASHTVTAGADNIPIGQGVVQDDNQPYPVYGWLEVAWVAPAFHP